MGTVRKTGPVDIIPSVDSLNLDNAFLHSAYGKMVVDNINHMVARRGPVLTSEIGADGYNTTYTYPPLCNGSASSIRGFYRGRAYIPEPYNAIRYSITAFDDGSAATSPVYINLGTGPWNDPTDDGDKKGQWSRTTLDFDTVTESDTANTRVSGVIDYVNISYGDRFLYWWVTGQGVTIPSFHLSAELIDG